MTVTADTLQTFAAVGNREQLLDDIYRIDPTDTPLLSMAKRMTGKAKFVEWQTQALASAATNAKVEGDEFVNKAVTATVRVGSRMQISAKTIQVSGTQQAVQSAGRRDELAYQKALATAELKRDMEFALTQNVASTAGNSSTAAKTGGLETWLTTNSSRGSGGSNGGWSSTNTTTATDGTQRAFTESLVKAVMLLCRASGGKPDTMMLGSFNRQVASTFTGNATKFKDITDKKLQASISVYESDFGKLKIIDNLFQRSRTGFLLDTSMLGVAYLRAFEDGDLAKTTDADKQYVLSEYGLVVNNEAAHGVIADLLTS